MTIVTQEEDLINYDSIKRISSFAVDVSDDESNEQQEEAYVLLAFDNNSTMTTDDVIENGTFIDGIIHLGIYGYKDELDSVVSSLIKALKNSEPVFVMPQPR